MNFVSAKRFYCNHCDFSCNNKQNLQNHSCYIRRNERSGKIINERSVQKRLQLLFKGKSKCVPHGRIDILTHDTIIEIKVWKNWCKAIGQIIYYSQFYPNHKRLIYFFGNAPPKPKKEAILTACKRANIDIQYETNSVQLINDILCF